MLRDSAGVCHEGTDYKDLPSGGQVTEDMRNKGGLYPFPEHDIKREDHEPPIGQYLRRRYFKDQEFSGFSSTFPPGQDDSPFPDWIKDAHFYNYTEYHNMTYESIFEAGLKKGVYSNVTLFDSYKDNDEYLKRVWEHKLAWAKAGGKGDYPVDTMALSPSYYHYLKRVRNQSKTGIPAVDPPKPPGMIKEGVDDFGEEGSDAEFFPVPIDGDPEEMLKFAEMRTKHVNPFANPMSADRELEERDKARAAHQSQLADTVGMGHLVREENENEE